MTTEMRSILSELRERLQAMYATRLTQIVLFGSHARGDAEPGSDVDVLVVLEGPVEPCKEIARTCEMVSSLSLTHGIVIACVFMDQDRFTHRQGPLLRNVRREGVPI